MPTGHFTYDARSDRWIDPDQPELGAVRFDEATDGRFYETGSNIFNAADGRLIGRVAKSAGSALTVTESGVALLQNNVRTRELNTETLRNAAYSTTLEGSVRLPTGDSFEVRGGYANLSGTGDRLYVPLAGARAKDDYLRAGAGETVPPGYRPATPQEMLARSTVGWLIKNAGSRIRELAASGFEVPGLGKVTDHYLVAFWLAQNLALTPTVTYDLSARVGL